MIDGGAGGSSRDAVEKLGALEAAAAEQQALLSARLEALEAEVGSRQRQVEALQQQVEVQAAAEEDAQKLRAQVRRGGRCLPGVIMNLDRGAGVERPGAGRGGLRARQHAVCRELTGC
jgi:hypothetical protein